MLAGLATAAAAALVAVVWLLNAGALTGIDGTVHETLRAYGLDHPQWLETWRVLTYLGSTVAVVLIDAVAIALCLRTGRPRTAAFIAIVAVGVWALRILLRDAVGRARPVDRLWPVEEFAFPSGHAANSATAAAVMIVATWPLLRRLSRAVLVIAALGLASAVGFSRLAGGVHWPSDVVAGVLLSLTVVLGVGALFASWPPTRPGAPPGPGDGPVRLDPTADPPRPADR